MENILLGVATFSLVLSVDLEGVSERLVRPLSVGVRFRKGCVLVLVEKALGLVEELVPVKEALALVVALLLAEAALGLVVTPSVLRTIRLKVDATRWNDSILKVSISPVIPQTIRTIRCC